MNGGHRNPTARRVRIGEKNRESAASADLRIAIRWNMFWRSSLATSLAPALPSGTILGRVLKESMRGAFEGGQNWHHEDSTANDSSPR